MSLYTTPGPVPKARPWWRRAALALGVAIAAATPRPAAAWDPATTHLGMIDRAALESAVHLRWMAGSELQRGLFSPLRVDPARLSPSERRFFGEAVRQAPSGAGVSPLGGPGACPGPKAPPATQLFCVNGDVWEMPALHWLHFGAIAELIPSAREVHHFVDRDDPASPRFNDPQQRPLVLRSRQFRHNGAPLAGYITGTSFAGTGPSAIAWLEDKDDPLAPPRTFAHLELASTHPDPRARDHHLAMALIGLGALLHVLQDMSVPAHARGDVTAFFTPITDTPGDRGLLFNELARLSFGRHGLPGRLGAEAVAEQRGVALADGLRAHFLGDADYEGVAVFTGRRFLSEHSVPEPRFLEPEQSPAEAAALLLAGANLDANEIQGATLSPWPAPRGYVKTATGRPLAAFDTDELGRVRAYIDEAVYREQFSQLAPRAVAATRSLLDWTWPSWPELEYDAAAATLDLAVTADLVDPELLVFTQTPEGERTITAKVRLKPGIRNRVANLPKLSEDQRSVVVLRARRSGGEPLIIEQVLGAESKTFPVVPLPYVAPVKPPALPEPEPEPEADIEAEADSEAGDETEPGAGEPEAAPAASKPTRRPMVKPGEREAAGDEATTKPAADKPATPPDKPTTPPADKPATKPASTPADKPAGKPPATETGAPKP